MRAIVLRGPGQYRLEEIPDPVPAPGEALIRVGLTGICGTDIHVLGGHNPFIAYPTVPGHEYSGRVVSAPAGSGLAPGDRVSVFPGVGCGRCQACREGRPPHCPTFKFAGVSLPGGSFAEYVTAPVERVFKLPEAIDEELGALIEPLAVGVHANRRAGLLEPGAGKPKVVVIGGGVIGLLTALVTKLSGAGAVMVSEPLAERRELTARLGLGLLVDPTSEDLVARAEREMGLADVVFDVVCNEQTLLASERMLRPDGCLVPLGLPHKPGLGVPFELIFKKELRVVGSRTYFMSDFAEAIDILAAGRLDLRPLVSLTLPLEQLSRGVDLLVKEPGRHVKILISSR